MKKTIFSATMLTKTMLFLFPIGLVTVEHWSSSFFFLLCLLSLIFLRKNISLIKLDQAEKIIILLMGLFFISFLLSSWVNGWERYHVRQIEDEIRFLLFAPLYLLIRRTNGAITPLIQGTVIGIFITFGVAWYEVAELGIDRASGPYGPLRLGPIVCVMAFIVMNGMRVFSKYPVQRALALVSIPLGVYAAYLSGCRTVFVLVIVLSLISVFLQLKNKRQKAGMLIVLIIAIFASHLYIPKITIGVDRVGIALEEVITTNDIPSLNILVEPGSSTKTRIAMGHAAYEIFTDNMIFGIGRGAMSSVIQEYIDSGRVNPSLVKCSNPHNILFETLVSKGIVGLSILLLLFGHLFRLIFKAIRINSYMGRELTIIVLSCLIIGFFEGTITINGGYISFMLVYLAVIYSAINEEKGLTSSPL